MRSGRSAGVEAPPGAGDGAAVLKGDAVFLLEAEVVEERDDADTRDSELGLDHFDAWAEQPDVAAKFVDR